MGQRGRDSIEGLGLSLGHLGPSEAGPCGDSQAQLSPFKRLKLSQDSHFCTGKAHRFTFYSPVLGKRKRGFLLMSTIDRVEAIFNVWLRNDDWSYHAFLPVQHDGLALATRGRLDQAVAFILNCDHVPTWWEQQVYKLLFVYRSICLCLFVYPSCIVTGWKGNKTRWKQNCKNISKKV